eukprot:UN01946
MNFISWKLRLCPVGNERVKQAQKHELNLLKSYKKLSKRFSRQNFNCCFAPTCFIVADVITSFISRHCKLAK